MQNNHMGRREWYDIETLSVESQEDDDNGKGKVGGQKERQNTPSLPSANLTCVGFCFALNASKSLSRFDLRRAARAIPTPRPNKEPIVAWMEIFRAADLRALRSSALKLWDMIR